MVSQLFKSQSQDEINAVATAAEIPEIPALGCLQCKSGCEPRKTSANADLSLSASSQSNACFSVKKMVFTLNVSQKTGKLDYINWHSSMNVNKHLISGVISALLDGRNCCFVMGSRAREY